LLQPTLNLGILAHVDAGKTTLTERLLHVAGVIDEVGSVDDGTTQTDTLLLERQRGITIKSAVVSFAIGDLTVNLIDTPGHPDFIAEVERALIVLDGAVLVVSAVEGVQSQTRILMRALRRLRIPTVIFVNKIDRVGASAGATLEAIRDRLSVVAVPMGVVHGIGRIDASFEPYDRRDPDFRTLLMELLSRQDDRLLAECLDDEVRPAVERLHRALVAQTRQGKAFPVFFGSAATGAGAAPLSSGLAALLPRATGDPEGAACGTVFKIERASGSQKVAYVRVVSGTIRRRDRLHFGEGREGVVTALSVFSNARATSESAAPAGAVAKLSGLEEIQIGDRISSVGGHATPGPQFPSPMLEAVVVPEESAHRLRLWTALTQMMEQDPLIAVRRSDEGNDISVSLYGEVQKEVIAASLENDYGLRATFNETTPICVERPRGSGQSVEYLNAPTNPFAGTLGLRVEPGPLDSGIDLRVEVEHVGIPLHLFKGIDGFRSSMQDYVQAGLREGLRGWQVTDCVVSIVECGYGGSDGPPSKRGPGPSYREFQRLTALVVMQALSRARTTICQPVVRGRLEVPASAAGGITAVLARLGAVVLSSLTDGSCSSLEAILPMVQANALQRQLPQLTSGEGLFEFSVVGYKPVSGEPPSRARTSPSPLNLKEYLRSLP
jgi:ribosomal protection tetracycline resistance protein